MLSALKLASPVSSSDRLDRRADAELADVIAPGEAQAALKAPCAVSPGTRLHSLDSGIKKNIALDCVEVKGLIPVWDLCGGFTRE